MRSRQPGVEFDEKKIDAIFAELDQCHLPGAAVGVAIGGMPVYRKGFGLASMELPVLLSPSIRMRIASATKHFASLAYLLLCEEGRAELDDPIGRHVPELHPVAHHVEVRHLMGHTGGLRDPKDICLQFSGTNRCVSSAELLALYRDLDDVNFAAGTAWSYNNGGYLLLTVAIERITGQSFEKVLWERIFSPVGMYDTMLRRWDTDFVPNSATLHMTTTSAAYHATSVHISKEAAKYEKSYLNVASAGEGGIVSTVDDLLRWLAHMDAPRVGTDATWRALKTPQTLANGTSTGYGLGLMSGRYRGVETLFHAGGTMGGNSQMLKVPAVGLDVVIMANRHDVIPHLLAEEILDACLPGLDSVSARPAHRPVTGTFHSPATGRVMQLFDRDGRQVASVDADSDMTLERDDAGVLRPAGLFSYLKQSLTLTGDPAKPASVRLCDFGNLDCFERLESVKSADIRQLLGTYHSATTGTEATILETEQGARLCTVGRSGSATFTLQCLAAGLWRARSDAAMSWGGILSFDRDNTGFRYSTGRTRGLRFGRRTQRVP